MLLSSSLSERFSLHARHALKEARDIARYTKSQEIDSRHLLLALALEEGSLGSLLLENLGFKKDALGKFCLKKIPRSTAKMKSLAPVSLSPYIQEVVKRAFLIASKHHYPYVGTEHLMSALLQSPDPFMDSLIEQFDVNQERVETTIESHLHFEQFPQMARMFDIPDFSPTEGKIGGNTPLLDQYTVDLALEAKTSPVTIVGREAELERLMQILGRKEKRNALLIGDPGVGKTALVTALACRIDAGTAGPLLSKKRIRGLDLALLVAGTSFRGEFETRLKELLKEVKQDGQTILFIDEIHTLVGTGNTQGGLDAANILKPSLARGDIQCIGATTLGEYKRHLEKDSALERRFQTILLREPTPEETVTILQATITHYETHHSVAIPEDTLREAVALSVRYIHDRFLPDKALDLIDEAGALVRRRSEQSTAPSPLHLMETKYTNLKEEKDSLIEQGQYDHALVLERRLQTLKKNMSKTNRINMNQTSYSRERTVTKRDLLTVLSHITHIPLDRLTHENPEERLKRVRKALTERFIGQDAVRDHLLRLLTRSLSPAADPKRPLGSLLFLGPTGVGKTYVAQVLAQEFFGDEQALIRLDMSEFMERHSIAQILGAPAGYVGYGEGGKLTEAVRRRPYSIVLFDEIEKAHPDVSNLLLQILDEGHLTDAEGRRVSFKNTLIILTSNIGTASFTRAARIGFSPNTQATHSPFEETKELVLAELKETLRPELLSRLDATLIFNPLTQASLEQIAQLELESLVIRLKKNGIKLTFRSNLPQYLAREAIKHGDGARFIRKQIAEQVEYLVSHALLTTPQPKSLALTLKHGALSVRR